ncbi:MAG: 6,7-dimethyl-8-ribityllumazine synthase [Patiriisocius sp.]|jgi:6,7-dimethyl-8-ribityllumazine synthase
MATAGVNLSEYDHNTIPSAKGMIISIVVSEWNNDITEGLLNGAKSTLLENGLNIKDLEINFVPGSFELPLCAQMILESKSPDAVICIGSVIRGETAHFDYVCEACALGIKDVGLKYNKPVIFCVLTDDNKQQSIDRSGGKHGNKGTEAAITAIKMIALQKGLE